jgi:hypothetical protein
MNIKNYTTVVPANRSIDEIEKLLIDLKCSNIMKQYEHPSGRCAALSFILDVDGMKLPFKLPANSEKVFKWLAKKKPQANMKNLREQAERIAWKQQYELLHLQLGMVEMNQVERLEALLPMLYDVKADKTYYEKVKAGGYKALIENNA